MAHLGEMSRPPLLRVLYVSLAAVAGVLWIWSGFTWWVAAPLFGGFLVAKAVLWFFPNQWEDTANGVALTLVAGLVIVWLLTFTPTVALGVAVGVGGLVCVAQLRAVLPPWAQWTAVGLSAVLAITCGLMAWLSWRADQERQAADERARHEYTVAELRPDRPLELLHLVVKAIHSNDPALVCFVFTPEAEREFAEEETGTTTCPAAINALHGRITGKGYGNATADPDEVNEETKDRPATVSGCRMYIVEGPLEYREPPGPELGTFRLERDPRFPNSGYRITRYTPCGKTDPDLPPPTPTRPPVLPSYPPGMPGILTKAIAADDPDVCGLFTQQGATQFANVSAADSCPEAITALSEKVTDPTAYGNPDGETVTSTTTGTVEIHACALTWNRFGQGAITAGPQLGHLTLIHPPDHSTGYLIDAVRPCQ
jgi:hypothetical protein